MSDIDDLLFEMDVLHQELLTKNRIGVKLVDSFMESLDKLPDEKKLEKVQQRIQLIKDMLSTPTSSFANGGEISEKSPVQSQTPSQTLLLQSRWNRNLLNLLLDSRHH